MIEATIFEGTDGDPLKRVYFRNTKGWVIRESFYNQLNQTVIEEMAEFDDKNKIVRHVLFIGNEHKAFAYRNVYQTGESQRPDKRLGCTDYKLIDGQFEMISYNIYEPSSKENPFSKTMFYNQDGELFYYTVDDTTRIHENIRIIKYFDQNDQMIEDFDTFFIEKVIKVETYDIIKSELLKQARDKYYDNK